MSTKPIIEVSHLTKQYKKAKTPAVSDISFNVAEGEFFAFLGPNGAGKTTTISILTTTLSKTSGTVTIAGHDLDHDMAAVRQNIGIIFQNPSLDLHLTAEENIRMHVGLYGLYGYRPFYRLMPAEYRRRVEELAGVVGLDENIFKPLKTFSGGMKRKLEIVRSLMHRPKILFLDEPTSGLDPVSRANLWEYLQKVRRESDTTVFLTTHYLDEAEGADRICVVQNGQILLTETPHDMKQRLVSREIVLDSLAADRIKLGIELETLGTKPVGQGPFSLQFEGATPQSLITGIKTPLTRLTIHEPTLEEAYVDLIRDQHAEGGAA